MSDCLMYDGMGVLGSRIVYEMTMAVWMFQNHWYWFKTEYKMYCCSKSKQSSDKSMKKNQKQQRTNDEMGGLGY